MRLSFKVAAVTILASLVLLPQIIQARNPPLYCANGKPGITLYGQNSDVQGITGDGVYKVREGIFSFDPFSIALKTKPVARGTTTTKSPAIRLTPTITLIGGTTRSDVVPGTDFIKPTANLSLIFGNHRFTVGGQVLIANSKEFKFTVQTPRGEMPVTISKEKGITDGNIAFAYYFERGHRDEGFIRSAELKATEFDLGQHIRQNKWVFAGSITLRDLSFLLKDRLSFIKQFSFDASYDAGVNNLALGFSPTLIATRNVTVAPQIGYEFGTNSVTYAAFFRFKNFTIIPVKGTDDGNKTFILILGVKL